LLLLLLRRPGPPVPPPFPYTTLFRSLVARLRGEQHPPGPVEAHPGAVAVAQRLAADAGLGVNRRTDDPLAHFRAELPLIELPDRSEEHTSELQSLAYLVCRLLLEKKN